MFRYRRYRVFVAFALFSIFLIYSFRGATQWAPEPSADAPAAPPSKPQPANQPQPQSTSEDDDPIRPVSPERPAQKSPPPGHPTVKTFPAPPKPAATPPNSGAVGAEESLTDTPVTYPHGTGGEGRVEVPDIPSQVAVIHWEKQKEHHPVRSTIQIPTGTPKPIPKIQFKFGKETAAEKAAREDKLNRVKAATKHAWDGYRKFAFGRDEVRPVSGGYRNPFNGWGATLVDSLDTLWIAGMEEEFEEAVDKITEIDFTTSARNDIPIFEVTIRYLGGLIAAYDVSGSKYKVLLDKAVELGEILIGAFDTPNRMPMTYYQWKPAFATQPHKAGTHVVLAEIGSLCMEFTRLAQITKEPKYYDAIARITDEFEVWQKNTRLPGMFPDTVDASGCDEPLPPPGGPATFTEQTGATDIGKFAGEAEEEMVTLKKPAPLTFGVAEGKPNADVPLKKPTPLTFGVEPKKDKNTVDVPLQKPEPLVFAPEGSDSTQNKARDENTPTQTTEYSALQKRGSAAEMAQVVGAGRDSRNWGNPAPAAPVPVCTTSGLASTSEYSSEKYTLGGQADSMYEYLPKMYLLLGGLEEKYRTMFEKSADVAIDKLVFRPMTPKNHDILISGSYVVPGKGSTVYDSKLIPEGSHLTCFVGGMFGMAAKIFNREEDLEVAKKLTDGCVWAYNSTATGIMPEGFMAVPCASKTHCEWNETMWYDALDPYYDSRMESYNRQIEQISREAEQFFANKAKATKAATPRDDAEDFPAEETSPPTAVDHVPITDKYPIAKRQLDEAAEPAADRTAPAAPTKDPVFEARKKALASILSDPSLVDLLEDGDEVVYVPPKPPSHEEYVKTKIEDERLPLGMSMIGFKKYILRPEAIESVFYMHRITGDPHWREVGWEMFRAIEQYTRTTHGHSAISDVTSNAPTQDNSMESFWIAETLKYFYLLFSDENVINLDEWVLNTEAHPFKRPKA